MHFIFYFILFTSVCAAPLVDDLIVEGDGHSIDIDTLGSTESQRKTDQSFQNNFVPLDENDLPIYPNILGVSGSESELLRARSPAPKVSTTKKATSTRKTTSTKKTTSSKLTSTKKTTSTKKSTSTSKSTPTKTTPTQPTSTKVTSVNNLPFKRMVAFGDNLSDNGNGSYAHGVTDFTGKNPRVYGYGTWTNGAVAVSYLSDMLSAPLERDYAYGHANGGSLFGATIDNAYTKSTANAPSSKDQIRNYTTSRPPSVADTLHYLWIGANDINLYHLYTDQSSFPSFARDMSAMLTAQVQTLLDNGAKYVFVPNLYAKHLSRSSEFYADKPVNVANLRSIIIEANNAIAAALAKFGNKVLVYDVFSFMEFVWNYHSAFGIDYVGKHQIDSSTQQDWDLYFLYGQGEKFYWMQFLDMTTHVHRLIAADMAQKIKAHTWA